MRLIPIILNHTLVIKSDLHQAFLNTMVLASLVHIFLDTQDVLWGISLNVNVKHIIEFFHLHIIPTTLYKDNMPYKYIYMFIVESELHCCPP